MRCSFFLCLTPNQLFGFSRKYVGIDDALLPNREWNQKQKHKKTALGQRGMLRHPLTRAHHIAPRIKTARRFTAKNP